MKKLLSVLIILFILKQQTVYSQTYNLSNTTVSTCYAVVYDPAGPSSSTSLTTSSPDTEMKFNASSSLCKLRFYAVFGGFAGAGSPNEPTMYLYDGPSASVSYTYWRVYNGHVYLMPSYSQVPGDTITTSGSSLTIKVYTPSNSSVYNIAGDIIKCVPGFSSVITASGSTSVCQGNTVNLSATPNSIGYSFQWNRNGSPITGATNSTYIANSTGNYNVTVYKNLACPAKSNTISISVSPDVVVTNMTSSIICQGDSAHLFANSGSGYTYQWNLNSVPISGATNQNFYAIQQGDYSVTINSGTCSGTSSTINITLNPLPTASIAISGATTFCQGNNVILTATTANSYLWSTGATTQSIIVSTSSNNYVKITDANGCSATSTITTVNVNPLPTVTAIASATTLCSGQSATITASGANLYSWNNGNTSDIISVTPTSNSTYTVTGTDGNGCTAKFSSTISINPLPVMPFIIGNTTICSGQSSTLSVSNICSGCSYSWSNGMTGQNISVNSGSIYSAVATNTCGVSSSSNSLSITVNPLPTVTEIVSTTNLCSGQSATITASGANTYSWNNGSTSGIISVTPMSNSTYTVTGTDGNGCTAKTSSTITVNSLPVITAIASTTNLCSGQSATITASGASNYSWNNGSTSDIISVIPTSNSTYTVTGTDGNGCSAKSSSTIIVNPLPVITAIASTTNLCSGQSATITASGANTYSWNNGNTSNIISVTPTGNSTFTVTGTDANGCSSIALTNGITVNSVPSTPTISQSGLVLTSSSASGNQWYLDGNLISGATNQTYTATQNGSYTVVVTVNGCASTTSSATNITSVNIDEVTNSNMFTIYPNPTTGNFTIASQAKQGQLIITNILGETIYSTKMNSEKTEIDLSNQSKGIYFVQVKTANGIYNQKIVIQ